MTTFLIQGQFIVKSDFVELLKLLIKEVENSETKYCQISSNIGGKLSFIPQSKPTFENE
jgi:hypothetical protein